MRKKPSEWPTEPEQYDTFLRRIGRAGGDINQATALRWALSLIDRPGGWRGMTPGDRQNIRLEIGCFAACMVQARDGRLLPFPQIPPPTEEEAQRILEMFDNLLSAAMRREPITFDTPSRRQLDWIDDQYAETAHLNLQRGWFEDARVSLALAIRDAGHLLKTCPAPASRGKEGETCDTRFVASRPNQAYCSARCQTRAATRAYRSGDSTPVAKMQIIKEHARRKSGKGA